MFDYLRKLFSLFGCFLFRCLVFSASSSEASSSSAPIATLSINYYDLGVATGKMALKVLVDGEDISKMPIEYAPQFTKEYNPEICEELGIEVPPDSTESEKG